MSYPSSYPQGTTLVNPAVLYAGTLQNESLSVGEVTANSTGTIPADALSWSLTVVGTAATLNGTAITAGSYSGAGPLSSAIALVTGSATTISYTYQTLPTI